VADPVLAGDETPAQSVGSIGATPAQSIGSIGAAILEEVQKPVQAVLAGRPALLSMPRTPVAPVYAQNATPLAPQETLLPPVVSEWLTAILPRTDDLKVEDAGVILAALAVAIMASMTAMAAAPGVGGPTMKHMAWRTASRRYRPGFEWPMAAAVAEDAAKKPETARPPRIVEMPQLRRAG
jgi:hypothetical protein